MFLFMKKHTQVYIIIICFHIRFSVERKFTKCEMKKNIVTAGEHFHSMTRPKMNLGMV